MVRAIIAVIVITALGVSAIIAQTRAPTSLPGCQYNASLPTLSDKQTTVLQCDSSGRLLLQ